MSEEKGCFHPYKIMPNDEVMIFRNEYGGNVFYKTRITKKHYDDTKSYFYKNVRFKKGIDLEDRTIIKIIDMFEDVRENKNDKYNAIWELVVTEFEIIPNEVKDKASAIENFNNREDIDDESFLNNEEIDPSITDDDLPF